MTDQVAVELRARADALRDIANDLQFLYGQGAEKDASRLRLEANGLERLATEHDNFRTAMRVMLKADGPCDEAPLGSPATVIVGDVRRLIEHHFGPPLDMTSHPKAARKALHQAQARRHLLQAEERIDQEAVAAGLPPVYGTIEMDPEDGPMATDERESPLEEAFDEAGPL